MDIFTTEIEHDADANVDEPKDTPPQHLDIYGGDNQFTRVKAGASNSARDIFFLLTHTLATLKLLTLAHLLVSPNTTDPCSNLSHGKPSHLL